MFKSNLTAIARTKQSKPYNYLIDNNYINREMSILDYGCGRGYDVQHLKRLRWTIEGFDPYQECYNDRTMIYRAYDAVTCNYVLNVIDNATERLKVLMELMEIYVI